jgi:uncharacterized protein YndB with AHSA1/START domain
MSLEIANMQVSRIIRAPRSKVYQAFVEPEPVAAWMAPDNMRGQVHAFDAREGGQFRVSLAYLDAADAQQYGKTAAGLDTYHGHFAELVPDEKIVQVTEFETDDPRFAGEMAMTVLLRDVDGGTEVTLTYNNLPRGIRPEDNEAGTRSSLAKLAALVE